MLRFAAGARGLLFDPRVALQHEGLRWVTQEGVQYEDRIAMRSAAYALSKDKYAGLLAETQASAQLEDTQHNTTVFRPTDQGEILTRFISD